jgi:DNA-binding FadR family transcriptional regulator
LRSASPSGIDERSTSRSRDSGGAKKGASQLASTIESDIIHAGWPVGQNFGYEDALLDHYGVGRAVLREAIRIVEQHQVATMRRGPKGGLIVTAPRSSVISDAMGVYLTYAGTTVRQLLEVRSIIDPLAAAAAAGRITEDGIVRLRAALAVPAEVAERVDPVGSSLHLLISELSGNVALALFVEVVDSLLVRASVSAPTTGGASRAQPGKGDKELASAIMGGDVGQAEVLARRNASQAIDRLGHRSAEASRTRRTRMSSPPPPRPLSSGLTDNDEPSRETPKMAASLADRIQGDIANRNWPVGERIGYEPELIASYGVSRAVLRETVRILEHRGVAEMKMGPAGGLVVATPDPAAAAEAMGLLLQFRGIGSAEVHTLRCGIELGGLDLAMAKGLNDEDLLSLRLATPHLDRNQAPPQGFCSNLHIRLAGLTGNPALQVFLSSILSLWRFYAHRRPTPYSPLGGYDLHAAHESIVDAIAAGDRAIARERMLRHLESVDS